MRLVEQQRLLAIQYFRIAIRQCKKRRLIFKFSTIEGKSDSGAKAGISYAIGYVSGFLIYIVLFIYGTMVMRGVMEEKVSRIAEVIVSSVKPFQLMMGKIYWYRCGWVGAVYNLDNFNGKPQFPYCLVIFPHLAAQMHSTNAAKWQHAGCRNNKNTGY